MLYASELFRAESAKKVELEENPDEIPDLVAEILQHAVEQRLRRNLSHGYRPREAILNRIRGRIDTLKTESHQLLNRGLVACRFDELTIDTPRNRYVRGALEVIARIVKRPDVASRCKSLARGFAARGVLSRLPTRAEMSVAQFGRNDSGDRLMVTAAKLAFDLALPTEFAGANLLSMPGREEVWVRRLFEKAIGGFYDAVLRPRGWLTKCGSSIGWQISQRTSGIDKILPSMRTDIVLNHAETARRIVIDTKFNEIVTTGWYRAESLRSGYVYQIYAYLRSQVGTGDSVADNASGLLLHPSIGQMVDETVVIQGHAIRFATVDLSATATEIRANLLRFVA